MPAKQVYGKRTKNTTTTSTYAKFLSPNKDDLVQEKRRAKAGAKEQIRQDVDIDDVEQQLKGLNLQDAEKKPSHSHEEQSRRHEARERDNRPPEQVRRKVAVAVQIERPPESSLHEDVIVFNEDGSMKGREARKALESRDVNAEVKSEHTFRGHKPTKQDKSIKNEGVAANTEDSLEPEQTSKENHDEPTTTSQADLDARVCDARMPAPSTPIRSSKSKPKKAHQTQSQPPMVPAGDIYTTYASPLLTCCEQREILPFEEWSSKLDACVGVEKIAEASFSEVYRLTIRDAQPGYANESVLKVVALRMPPNAPLPGERTDVDRPRRKADAARQLKKEREKREEDDQWKSRVEDVLSEVKLLSNLNHIPGFTNFRELTIIQGCPSTSFGRAWKEWNKPRPKGKKSEFPDPSKKASYEDTQLWAVIEMGDAGTDCGKIIEKGGITTVWEVWDIFWGVCLSVAKAEEACRFEHRDLHMDNICVRPSTTDISLIGPSIRNPLKRKFRFTGLETTVIDYTLSRADIITASRPTSVSPSTSTESSTSPPSSRATQEREVAYLDLNKDMGLFKGDAEVEYQYEIYRYMRGSVYRDNPLWQDADPCDNPEYTADSPRRSPRKHEDTTNETPRRSPRNSHRPSSPPEDIWEHFYPKTNLVWAHFILYSLLQNLEGNEPNTISPASIMHNIEDANPADSARIHKKAIKLHKILLKVATLLEPEMLGRKSRLFSMRDLVILALETNWLSLEDVSGDYS